MTALFSKFFKKNRPSKPALKKAPAVDQAPLAQGTSEHDHISLGQIQEIERLDALEPFLSAKPQHIKTAAIDRLESLLFEGATSLEEKTQKLNTYVDEGIALKLVALWHPDEALQRQAIVLQLEQGSTTQEQICAWIEQCPVSRTRQTLAEHLTQEPLLEQLYQHFRSKDKRLSRQLKDKLLEYQETKRAQTHALNTQLKIVGQLEQLALSAYSPNYSAQVLHAQQQWQQQLPTIEPELQTRFATALKQAQSQIDLHQAEERAQEALNQAITTAHQHQQELVTEAQALLEQLKASDPDTAQQRLREADTETCQSSALSQLQQRWSEAAVAAKPDANTKAAFQAALKPLIQFQESSAQLSELSGTLTSLIEDTSASVHTRYQRLSKQLKSIQWPKEFERPKQLSNALEAQQHLERQVEAAKAQEKQSLKACKNALKSFREHLNKQWLKESQKYHQKAAHLLKLLSPKAAEPLQAEFKLLSAQLQELKDWQGFATLPKREALCESMEALLTSDMHPETLATAIQALQDEWKALGGGDPKISQPLWERFKAASDQAYASCKAFYTAQAEIRQKNFEARTRICEELEQLLSDQSWDRSHWKAVQTIIEGARTQWRQYTPVDRIKNKPLQNRFQKNILALRVIVQATFDQNAAAKSDLVDQAQALLSLSDLKQATEQAKQLQQEWKSLGNAGNQDQTLWKAFREHCDALFDKRQNEYLAKKEAIQCNIEQAESLVRQGQALLDQPALSTAERLKANSKPS
jgi:exonuclease SbcC